MENITNEQQEFDQLMEQLNNDFQNYPDLFTKTDLSGRTLITFNNDSDALMLISKESKILTFFRHADDDYVMIDGDYVESSQDFSNQMTTFEAFYQVEKEATMRHLASQRINMELEATVEVEPYSFEWLQDSENATWEIEWHGEFQQDGRHLTENLYQTKDGELILHKIDSDRGSVMYRDLSAHAVKEFVMDRYSDYKTILSGMGIEMDEVDLAPTPEQSTPLSPQEQLLTRIEAEYESFKAGMKENSKEEMMDMGNAYEIAIKNEIVHYARESYISDEMVETLLESENLLDDLYDEYTATDSNEFFEPIHDAINNHIEQYLAYQKEVQPTVIQVEVPDDHVPEFTNYLEVFDSEELDSNERYVEVQPSEEVYVPLEELDADGVRNMKKHKRRTNIRNLDQKELE